ncbi:MAG: CoA transferase, partial [Dehalococcoidia bacterium]
HFWYLEERLIRRGGPLRAEISGALKQRQIWRCRDGWISFALYGGQFGARNNKPLAAWMEQEGFGDDFLRDVDWDKLDMSSVSPEYVQELEERIARFFEAQTKEQISKGAMERRIILLPLLGIDEAFRSPQLEDRGFWTPIDHGETGKAIHYPAFFYKSSLGSFGSGSRPPLPGEHNAEIYGRIGLSSADLSDYQRRGII